MFPQHVPQEVTVTRMNKKQVLIGLALLGAMLLPVKASAQSMGDYTSVPPFVGFSAGAPPNVLFILDDSGSMNALQSKFINGTQWKDDITYSGMWDSLTCYTYDVANTRFDAAGAKAAIASTCGATEWDGNILNWFSQRRLDVSILAMTGGICVGGRNPDGTCIPSGTPAKWTTSLANAGTRDANNIAPFVLTGAGPNKLGGRVPTALQSGQTSLWFNLIGGNPSNGQLGTICVDNDNSYPADNGPLRANPCDYDGTGLDSDAYVETQIYLRLTHDQEPEGVIQSMKNRGRLGLMMFGDDARGRVLVPIGSPQNVNFVDSTTRGQTVTTFQNNTAAMLSAVEGLFSIGGSTSIHALYQGMRYYAQLPSETTNYQGAFIPHAFSPASALNSGGAGSLGSLGNGEADVLTGSETCPAGYVTGACGRDPMFFGSDHVPPWSQPSSLIECCSNFIILIGDGGIEASNLPSALQTYAYPLTGNSNTNYDLVDTAYWGHINDLRQGTVPVINESGHDIPGAQNVTTFAFFAYGTPPKRALYMDIAKYGGFVDSNGNNEPDLTSEWDAVNNATGADGADGLPDTYYEFTNYEEMQAGLTTALNNLLVTSAAGSAASVLASSSTGEGAVYRAYFDPTVEEASREIKWVGYMQSLFIDPFGNLREDDGDLHLEYKDDKIIRTRFDDQPASATFGEVLVDRFLDMDENGLADTTTPVSTGLLKDITPVWEAGKKLAETASSARNLFTWIDVDGDGIVDAGERLEFNNGDGGGVDNTAALAPYLNPGAAPFSATNIISFVRGQQVAGMRDRELTVGGSLKVWKLADAIHSSPIVVGAPGMRYDVLYGDASYSAFLKAYYQRRQVVYMGANDGMLHAFNGGYFHPGDDPGHSGTEHGYFTKTPDGTGTGKDLGVELFGFVPQELLPHLKWLSRASYSHVYYVDLTPKAVDVRIFCDAGGGAPAGCVPGQSNTVHPNGWGTILIGGFRLGGSCGACLAGTGASPMTVTGDFDNNAATADTTRTFYSAYFVLDVTNPEEDPHLVWSFSSPDLGLTTGVPSVLRVNPTASTDTDHTNAKWYLVMGSGPTGYDGSAAQTANLYAFDLMTGPESGAIKNNDLVTTMAVEPTLNSFMSSTLTIDRNLDYRVDVTYTGSAIDDGTPPWRGKLHRLTMNPCAAPCSTATWGIPDGGGARASTEVLDNFAAGTLNLGPVTARPAAAFDNSNKLWVFAGTGRYFNHADGQSTAPQYFVGVKDSVINAPGCSETTRTSCLPAVGLVDVSAAQVCVLGTGTCGAGTNQVTGVTGATDFPGLIGLVASRDGWYTTLPASGERSLSEPTVFGGLVLISSFIPGASALCDQTTMGESFLYALYYLTGSAYSSPVVGTTGATTKTVNRSTKAGAGGASQAVVHVGHNSKSGKARAYIQLSTGELKKVDFDAANKALTSRLLSWHDS